MSAGISQEVGREKVAGSSKRSRAREIISGITKRRPARSKTRQVPSTLGKTDRKMSTEAIRSPEESVLMLDLVVFPPLRRKVKAQATTTATMDNGSAVQIADAGNGAPVAVKRRPSTVRKHASIEEIVARLKRLRPAGKCFVSRETGAVVRVLKPNDTMVSIASGSTPSRAPEGSPDNAPGRTDSSDDPDRARDVLFLNTATEDYIAAHEAMSGWIRWNPGCLTGGGR